MVGLSTELITKGNLANIKRFKSLYVAKTNIRFL